MSINSYLSSYSGLRVPNFQGWEPIAPKQFAYRLRQRRHYPVITRNDGLAFSVEGKYSYVIEKNGAAGED